MARPYSRIRGVEEQVSPEKEQPGQEHRSGQGAVGDWPHLTVTQVSSWSPMGMPAEGERRPLATWPAVIPADVSPALHP